MRTHVIPMTCRKNVRTLRIDRSRGGLAQFGKREIRPQALNPQSKGHSASAKDQEHEIRRQRHNGCKRHAGQNPRKEDNKRGQQERRNRSDRQIEPALVVYDTDLYSEQEIAKFKELGLETYAFEGDTLEEYIKCLRRLATKIGAEIETGR